MEPSLEIQKAIRQRLVADAALTAQVPAASIVDRNALPATFPCIIIGEGQTALGAGLDMKTHNVFTDLHVWAKETGLTTSKQLVGLVRKALFDGVAPIPGLHVADIRITGTRFLRDPDGALSHGVVNISAIVMEQ